MLHFPLISAATYQKNKQARATAETASQCSVVLERAATGSPLARRPRMEPRQPTRTDKCTIQLHTCDVGLELKLMQIPFISRKALEVSWVWGESSTQIAVSAPQQQQRSLNCSAL